MLIRPIETHYKCLVDKKAPNLFIDCVQLLICFLFDKLESIVIFYNIIYLLLWQSSWVHSSTCVHLEKNYSQWYFNFLAQWESICAQFLDLLSAHILKSDHWTYSSSIFPFKKWMSPFCHHHAHSPPIFNWTSIVPMCCSCLSHNTRVTMYSNGARLGYNYNPSAWTFLRLVGI